MHLRKSRVNTYTHIYDLEPRPSARVHLASDVIRHFLPSLHTSLAYSWPNVPVPTCRGCVPRLRDSNSVDRGCLIPTHPNLSQPIVLPARTPRRPFFPLTRSRSTSSTAKVPRRERVTLVAPSSPVATPVVDSMLSHSPPCLPSAHHNKLLTEALSTAKCPSVCVSVIVLTLSPTSSALVG